MLIFRDGKAIDADGLPPQRFDQPRHPAGSPMGGQFAPAGGGGGGIYRGIAGKTWYTPKSNPRKGWTAGSKISGDDLNYLEPGDKVTTPKGRHGKVSKMTGRYLGYVNVDLSGGGLEKPTSVQWGHV